MCAEPDFCEAINERMQVLLGHTALPFPAPAVVSCPLQVSGGDCSLTSSGPKPFCANATFMDTKEQLCVRRSCVRSLNAPQFLFGP